MSQKTKHVKLSYKSYYFEFPTAAMARGVRFGLRSHVLQLLSACGLPLNLVDDIEHLSLVIPRFDREEGQGKLLFQCKGKFNVEDLDAEDEGPQEELVYEPPDEALTGE